MTRQTRGVLKPPKDMDDAQVLAVRKALAERLAAVEAEVKLRKIAAEDGVPAGTSPERGSAALRRRVRRRKFVRAYLTGGEGIAGRAGPAALQAGLARTPTSAAVRGSLLLKDPLTLNMIARELDAIQGTTERITQETGRIAFATVHDLEMARQAIERGEDLDGLPDHVAAVIREVEVTPTRHGRRVSVKGHDKMAALTLYARIRQMLAVRVEHTGADGGPMQHVVFYVPSNGREVIEAEIIPPPALPPPPSTNGHVNGHGG